MDRRKLTWSAKKRGHRRTSSQSQELYGGKPSDFYMAPELRAARGLPMNENSRSIGLGIRVNEANVEAESEGGAEMSDDPRIRDYARNVMVDGGLTRPPSVGLGISMDEAGPSSVSASKKPELSTAAYLESWREADDEDERVVFEWDTLVGGFSSPLSSRFSNLISRPDSARSDTSTGTAIHDRDRTPRASQESTSLNSHPLPPLPSEEGHDKENQSPLNNNSPPVNPRSSPNRANMAQNTGNPNQAAPYPLGGPVMPAAGHHHDMQHIWGLIEELSSVLQQNRESVDEVQDIIARVQAVPAEPSLTNGDHSHDSPATAAAPAPAPSSSETEMALAAALGRINELEEEIKEANSLTEYSVEMVSRCKQMIRDYAHGHNNATIALHAHYNKLLETSRMETIKAQITHQEWQGSLHRLSTAFRGLYNNSEEESLHYRSQIAGLKYENRILRRQAGWEPASDNEGSDDEGERASQNNAYHHQNQDHSG